jgi:sirohydrochlorin ferrochelatase
MRPLVLVAHGSRNPRAATTTHALARVVAAARPGLDVRVSFLELAEPAPAAVLRAIGGPAVVVPLLLTNAYHRRIDLPAQVRGFDVALAEPLGRVSEHLLEGLVKRLHESAARPEPPRVRSMSPQECSQPYNGICLAAAGTRMCEARATVEEVARALGERLGVPAQVAYAAGAQPSGGEAVRMLRERGADRVGVAAYFLAPGQLYATVTSSAMEAGAIAAAEPLGASPDLACLILDRYDACSSTILPNTAPELSFSNA